MVIYVFISINISTKKLTWEKNAKVEEEEGGEAGTQPDDRQVEVGRVLHNGETVSDR